MAEKTAETKKVETAQKPTAPKVEIVRGQMPAPIVFMIKKEDSALTDGALAAKWRTTNGKISDIRKNRNFGYIDDSYVPDAAEIEKAKAWAANHGGEEIIKAVEALVPGEAEARAKYEAARTEFKAKNKKTAAPAAPAKTEEKPAEKPVDAKKSETVVKKVGDKELKDLTA